MENQMKLKNVSDSKPAIGKWQIGDGDNFISFALTEKPNWFRRKMANLFFGLVWYDFKSPIDVKDVKPSKGIKAKVTKEVPKGRR
jgi:hypothetical protein